MILQGKKTKFQFKYLREMEAIFESNLACQLWVQMG